MAVCCVGLSVVHFATKRSQPYPAADKSRIVTNVENPDPGIVERHPPVEKLELMNWPGIFLNGEWESIALDRQRRIHCPLAHRVVVDGDILVAELMQQVRVERCGDAATTVDEDAL